MSNWYVIPEILTGLGVCSSQELLLGIAQEGQTIWLPKITLLYSVHLNGLHNLASHDPSGAEERAPLPAVAEGDPAAGSPVLFAELEWVFIVVYLPAGDQRLFNIFHSFEVAAGFSILPQPHVFIDHFTRPQAGCVPTGQSPTRDRGHGPPGHQSGTGTPPDWPKRAEVGSGLAQPKVLSVLLHHVGFLWVCLHHGGV